MSLDLLCDPVSIDLDTIKLGSVKGKWKKSDVKVFKDKKEIQLKTGIMETKYGIQMNSYKKDEHYIDLTTNNDSFVNAILKLDEKIVDELVSSLNLFGENISLSKDQIKNSFMGIAKSKSPFNIRLILPKNDLGNFDWSLFDSNKKEIKVTSENVTEFVPKNSLCKVIFNLDRIWYFQERFGIICKLKQLKLEDPPKETPKNTTQKDQNYLFLD